VRERGREKERSEALNPIAPSPLRKIHDDYVTVHNRRAYRVNSRKYEYLYLNIQFPTLV
jgi:hypothetical protein